MKYLVVFLLCFGGLFALAANRPTSTVPTDEAATLLVTVTYVDGCVDAFPLHKGEKIADLLLEKEVFVCTVQFEGGECMKTRRTCAEAQAAFESCACESGRHPRFCPEDQID